MQSGATDASIADFINEFPEVIQTFRASLPVPVDSEFKAEVKDALKEVLEK